ncbi:hypothetical protein AB5J72_08835 [Streptomyces sp. CG1]|uniref:hypothetical protein n=1 Tax=Streptomyces sp. CG1 TaxID=1287523 RepID=UPI0034E24840
MILKDWATEERVMQLAAGLDLEVVKDSSPDVELGIVRHVTWRVVEGLILEYAVDSRSRTSFLAVGGSPAEGVREIERSIEKNLEPWTLRELLSAVDRVSGAGDLTQALLRAGVGSPHDFDKRFFKRIKAAFGHPDPRVRYAGLWATAYSRWSEFRDLIAEMAESDDVDDLRRDARVILRYYAEGREG